MVQNQKKKSCFGQRGLAVGVNRPRWQSIISEGDWCEACGFLGYEYLEIPT